MASPIPAAEPRWRFLLLTVTLCAWMLVAPHAGDRLLVQLLMQLFLIHFVVVTLWASPKSSRLRGALLACWVLSLLSAGYMALPLVQEEHRLARTIQGAALIPLVVLLATGMLRYVFAHRKLDTDGIFATVGAYLLIAILFAQIYTLLLLWDPECIRGPVDLATRSPQQLQADLLYYSLITLATVGYGDFLPVSDTARTVAVIEATVGQFYLTVIVAVFVGMLAAQAQKRGDAGEGS